MDSVVLDKGIKSMLLDDAQEFLKSEQWYADRGIPWRRGYLLHGCPGSGKTSLIHALAGELDLDIYVISLSQRDMDDSALNRLITTLPPKAIALMEDIDVAFTRGPPPRPQPKTPNQLGVPWHDGYGNAFAQAMPMDNNTSAGSITLAGLLGAIDGVAAQEGRILFATTNRYHVLDTALKRPGRLDIHVEFKEASRKQAEELFKRFYPAAKQVDSEEMDKDTETEKPLIDITGSEVSASNDSLSEKQDSGSESESETETEVATTTPKEAPKLSETELSALATQFASTLPEREFTMAAIQGHLMRYKTQPHRAIKETGAFVQREREQKEAEKRARELAEEEKEKEKEKQEEKEKEKQEGEQSAEENDDGGGGVGRVPMRRYRTRRSAGRE